MLKDFANIERCANPDTIVLVHDCLPLSVNMTTRTQVPGYWTGDVWKALSCLETVRPDLSIRVIPTRPTGLGVITNLNPAANAILAELDRLAAKFRNAELEYEFLSRSRIRDSRTYVKNDPDSIANEFLG